MNHEFDVVGVGCCAVDTLAIYDGPIEEDQKMQVHGTTRQGGGLVATGLGGRGAARRNMPLHRQDRR